MSEVPCDKCQTLSTAALSWAASWTWRVDTAVMGRGASQASRTWPTGQVMVCSRSWTGGLNDINREVLGSSLKLDEIYLQLSYPVLMALRDRSGG